MLRRNVGNSSHTPDGLMVVRIRPFNEYFKDRKKFPIIFQIQNLINVTINNDLVKYY